MAMTPNVKRFVRFNQKHAVISGTVFSDRDTPHDPKKPSGSYTLANHMTFRFTRVEMRSMPAGFPDWKFDGTVAQTET